MEPYTIAIVGCGGIGSYLCNIMKNLEDINQLNQNNKQVIFHIFDDDVVNSKNLRYQYFYEDEITDLKAEVIGFRNEWDFTTERIKDESQLNDFDLIVSAVDNNIFRSLLFKWANKNPEKDWIDLRSEGRSIAYFTKHKKNTLEKMLKSIEGAVENNGSCQLPYELNRNIIQQGNKIVANIGSQLILNLIRGDYNSHQFIGRF